MRPRAVVTPEERERILSLRGQGLSVTRIAALTGRAEGTIHGIVTAGRKRDDPRCRVLTQDEINARIVAGRNAQAAGMAAASAGGGAVSLPASPAAFSSGAIDCASEMRGFRSAADVSSHAGCPPANCAPSASAEGATLSVEEEAAIVAAFERGATVHSIAVARKRNRNTILRALERNGLMEAPKDAKPAQRHDKAMRRCLGGCGRMFESQWIGHRICDRCRSTEGAGAFR